jgi:glucan biosynthesis protein
VAEAARKLATEPYRAPAQIPDFLSSLSYDDFATSGLIQLSLGGARAATSKSSSFIPVCITARL